MKKYEEIEHTADLGIRVYGNSLEELFSNSAWAMMDCITDLKVVEEEKSLDISIEAEDKESLLVRWLEEILYYLEVKGVIFKSFKVNLDGEKRLKAEARGEDFKEGRHIITKEIKAVTYHTLEIKQINSKLPDGNQVWQAQIIFDV